MAPPASSAARTKAAKGQSVKDARVAKASVAEDDVKSNGKRGRPRVDSQDQSAVEVDLFLSPTVLQDTL